MKIGELARVTRVKSVTIRFYERIGLLPVPDRTGSNYRDYGRDDQQRVVFIRDVRSLGFEIADVRSLMGMDEQLEMDCGEVDRLATGHLETVEQKIAQLERLRSELRRTISRCRSGPVPDCRIIRALVDDGERTEAEA